MWKKLISLVIAICFIAALPCSVDIRAEGVVPDVSDTALYSELALGDADVNGKINSGDLLFIRRVLLGLEVPTDLEFILADLNGNGEVDESDLDQLTQYLKGERSSFSAPGIVASGICGTEGDNPSAAAA